MVRWKNAVLAAAIALASVMTTATVDAQQNNSAANDATPSATPTTTPTTTNTATPTTTPTPTTASPTPFFVPASCAEGATIQIFTKDSNQAAYKCVGSPDDVAVGLSTAVNFVIACPSVTIVSVPDTLQSLEFSNGGNASSPPVVNASFDFSNKTLYTLSFSKVNFKSSLLELKVPDVLTYLNVDLFGPLGFWFVSQDAYNNLTANIDTNASATSFELGTDCGTGVAELGKIEVCPDTSTTNAPSAASTPSPSATTSDGSSGSSSTTLIVVIVLVVAVVLVVAAFLVYRRRASRSKTTGYHAADDNSVNLIGKDEASGKLSFISSDESLRGLRLQQHEVTLTKSVGAGRLWLGEFTGNKVLVKRVEAEVSDAYITKNLMNQAQVLATLSHQNIVSLVGVTWLAGTDFAIVAEFMDKGNLKSVLMDNNSQYDLQAKLGMCLDIAKGLAHLHSSECNMYVRNLSSRKVLVNSSLECKLNLFDCYPNTEKFDTIETYGMGQIAWQAPEIITRSAPQDPKRINIYAFGVIMCEILARATPFQSLVEEVGNTLSDVEIVRRVRRQETLAPHENRREYMRAPQSLRDTIDLCLSLSPMNRPSAEEIIVVLQAAQANVVNTII
ncbi:Tkl protein kinase, partial [Globisporangium splendens]